jgi:predicted small integral membrane protein
MLVSNPFAELSATISPGLMQAYVWLMMFCVVAGTLFDIVHKQSAKYFFENWRSGRTKGDRQVGGGEIATLAVKTLAVDVATSAEFCNPHRRVAHLLTMYGFIAYVVSTAVMVLGYPTSADSTPVVWPLLWTLGALMICVGGCWFWFFIRADVSAEGQSPFRLMRADLFVLSLLGSAAFGLVWACVQSAGGGFWSAIFLILYLIATTVLFGSVPWSKLSHMFFKPAAAFEKRVSSANGSAQNLPMLTRDDPEQQKRHSMELLQDAPMNMGLGIKREAPRHY